MALDLFPMPGTKKPAVRTVKPAVKPEPPTDPEPDPQKPSVLRRIGSTAGGGLSAVGNILDLPVSMVRDIGRGHNPFDQLLTPTSDANRTTGRELLRHHGLVGEQDTWGNFAGGLAADIALDPLTYLTAGSAAVAKKGAGGLAKAAGVLDDAARVAAKARNVPVGSIGKNEARLTTTLGHYAQHAPEAFQKVETAAKAKGVTLTPEMLNEPLGSLFRFGGMPLGSGATATKIAAGIDKAKSAVQFAKVPGTQFQPVNEFMRLFHSPLKEATTKLGQVQAAHLFKQHGEIESKLATETAGHANAYDAIAKQFNGVAGFDEINPDNFRKFMEMKAVAPGAPVFPPQMHELRDKLLAPLQDMPQRALEQGRTLNEHIDPMTNYFPSYIAEALQRGPGKGGGQAFSTFDPSSLSRYEWRNGIPEGASLVKEIAQHPELKAIMDAGATKDDVAKWIGSKFGHRMPPTYASKAMEDVIDPLTKNPVIDPVTHKVMQQPVMKDRFKDMATDIHGLSPETRAAGIYGNHPILDWSHRMKNEALAHANTEKVFETLAQPGVLQTAANAPTEGTKTLEQVFSGLSGLDPQLASSILAQRTGQAIPKGTRVASDVADDLTRMMKGFQTPDPVNPILGAADSLTNLFKGGVTSVFPSFHSRNFTSGQVQNMMTGMFSPQSVRDAHDLIKGRIVKDAGKIPAVQALAAERGIKEVDDEVGTKLLGELAHGHGVAPKFEGELGSVVGNANNLGAGSLEDLISGIPGVGRVGFTAKKLADLALARKNAGTTWNPLKATQRGVNGAVESTFAPSAAGQYLGSTIEGLNRMSPFIHQLRQGIDPAEAARRISHSQVSYSGKSYSKFEKQVMKRLIPFYSFSKGMAKFVPQHLAEHPGGPMAQSFRLANRAHNPDESTPDYVRDTLSAPLNGVPIVGNAPEGTSRFLSGLGLMGEDPAAFVGSPSNALLEGVSRLNPLIKAPLEMATNQSFFQRSTAGGGRSLDDLDPTFGRIISNLSGAEKATTFPGSKALEFIAGNSPAARALTTVRQLTDPRKNAAVKGLNTLTGLRISDVSPGAKDALTREHAQIAMKEMGAKNFLRTYFPKADLENMTPARKKEALEYQSLLNQLAKDAKRRKELAAK